MLSGKKLLILGGSTIGCREITEYANSIGVYTIVADYLELSKSPAKLIASEHWEISTSDLDELERMARLSSVDGVIAGVSEFNIEKTIELCERLNLPCYANTKSWQYCTNKKLFKSMCRKYNIPITKEYHIDCTGIIPENIEYPVIVKPADSCASRGFCVCNNEEELKNGYMAAMDFSQSREVLVEKYMPYPASIIHYTAHNGTIHFSGITDKKSMKIKGKESLVMAIQMMPSDYCEEYIKTLDEKVKLMFEKEGMHEGPIWIEAFNDEGNFTFNEMGYRFGGSLTYYPVEYFNGYNQMHMMVEYALTGESTLDLTEECVKEKYCILPVHIKPGIINKVTGLSELLTKNYIKAIVPVHHEGDEIKDWGTAQQVYSYVHIIFSDIQNLKVKINEVKNSMHVMDGKNNEMLFYLFDIDSL